MKPIAPVLAALLLTGPAVFAHELVANRQVGALMHIQPDDNPKAREPAVTWIALTRRGGTPVKLGECDCTLQIYSGRRSVGRPLATPTLREGRVSGEIGNPDRLLADVTFPATGSYTLVLTGKPKAKGSFTPFRFQWQVEATP